MWWIWVYKYLFFFFLVSSCAYFTLVCLWRNVYSSPLFTFYLDYLVLLLNSEFFIYSNHCCYLIARPCLTLLWRLDYSPSGSFVHGISQARILEQVAISFSRLSFQPRDRTRVSCIGRRILYQWATREACILITRPLSDIWFANILSHCIGSFHCLDSVLKGTKVFSFDEVQFFSVFLLLLVLWCISNNPRI